MPGTAATWQGLLGYLENDLVDLVIYENSDNLDDGTADSTKGRFPAKADGLQDVSNLGIFNDQFFDARL